MIEFNVWSVEKRNKHGDSMGRYSSRWMESLCRLVGILHVARHLDKAHEVQLSEETVSAGIDAINYFMKQQYSFIGAKADKQNREQSVKLIKELLAAPEQKMTVRDLTRRHGWNKDEALKVAALIPRHVVVTKTKGGKGNGRLSDVLSISSTIPLVCRRSSWQ